MKKRKIRKLRKLKLKDNLIFRLSILLVSSFLLLIIWLNRGELRSLSGYGYIGLFVVNFISAATILIPAPGTISVFIGGAVWNPFIVGVISGLGSALGELFAYFLGYGGRGVLKTVEREGVWVKRVEGGFYKKGFLTIFLFSIVPLPIFDIVGIIAGAVNFPVVKFFLATVFGRMLRNILFALTGARFLPG